VVAGLLKRADGIFVIRARLLQVAGCEQRQGPVVVGVAQLCFIWPKASLGDCEFLLIGNQCITKLLLVEQRMSKKRIRGSSLVLAGCWQLFG
jgi:hypothetical protein